MTLTRRTGKRVHPWLRKLAGWCWLLAWAWVLWQVARPWRDLGGLVGERLRWAERFVLGAGVVVGCQAGAWGRAWSRPGSGRSHARLLRFLLWPQAAAVAAALLTLRLFGVEDPIGVVVTGFLAYWAGLDTAFAAWPLVLGQDWGFRREILPDPRSAEEDSPVEPGDPPRWLGY